MDKVYIVVIYLLYCHWKGNIMTNELSIEKIFEKPLYKNIMFMIVRSTQIGEKIKFHHICSKICVNHGYDTEKLKRLNDFFMINKKAINIAIKRHKDAFESGKIKKQTYDEFVKWVSSKESFLDSPFFDKTIKFDRKVYLSRYLKRLQDNINPRIVEKKHDRRGSYYIATEYGIASFYRYIIKDFLDKHFPDDQLFNLIHTMLLLSKNKSISFYSKI